MTASEIASTNAELIRAEYVKEQQIEQQGLDIDYNVKQEKYEND